ncbi:MAG: PAS domain S-box protein [bacterium]
MVRVKEITGKNFAEVSSNHTVGDSVELIKNRKTDYLVIKERGKTKGIIKFRDILGYPPSRLLLDCPVTPVGTVSGTVSAREALKLMQAKGENILLVLNKEKKPASIIDSMMVTAAIFNEMDKLNEEKKECVLVTKDNEEQLKQYKQMVEFAQDVIFFKDLKSRYVIANDKTLKVFGLSREEVIGKNDYEIMPVREEAGKNIEDDKLVFKTGKPAEITKHMTGADGRERWFHAIKVPQFDDKGNIVGLIGIARDVTKSRKAEEIRKKYEFMVNTLNEFMTLVDRNYVYTAVNDAYCRAHNKKREEIIGGTVKDVWGEETFNRIIKVHMDRCFAGEEVHYRENFDFTALGRRYFDVACYPYKGSNGKISHQVIITRDITERKKVEDLLKEAKEYTANIIESMIDILVVTDSDGKLKTVNQAGLKLLGYKKEDIIAQPVGKLFAEEEEEEEEEFHMRTFKKIIKEGHITNYKTSIKTASGKEIPVILSGSALRDENKNLIGMVIVVKDMTGQDNLQKRMLQQAKLASIGQLAAGVAHELNNPLTTIVAMSDLLSVTLESSLKRDDRKNLALIKEAGLRMKNIVNNLLSFSRPVEKGIEKEANLNSIIKKVYALLESEIKKEMITVEKNLTHIPCILGDSDRLMEVFINLFSNSIYALKSSKDKNILIKTEYSPEKKLLKLRFRDSGKGVKGGIISDIFNPFFTTKQAEKGTGLGLSIVYEILNDHGGNIEVSSEEGKFTEFVISFSVDKDGRRVTPEKATGRPKILAVDDDKAIVSFIEESLKIQDRYEIFTALDGFQAGQEVAKRNLDLVILDIFLPGINGFDVCRNIRGRKNGIKIIAITGRATEENRRKILEAGADAYLIKPFSKAKLLKNVKELIGSK